MVSSAVIDYEALFEGGLFKSLVANVWQVLSRAAATAKRLGLRFGHRL